MVSYVSEINIERWYGSARLAPSEEGEVQVEVAEEAEELLEQFRQSIELVAFPDSFLFFSLYVPDVLLEADADAFSCSGGLCAQNPLEQEYVLVRAPCPSYL